ncbi:MAG: PilZ domain-containing protein [Lamprobacter sp.]|nr:PilZ domain-containing protein [Lamprobacter sp.]
MQDANYSQLAEELAEFWFSALEPGNWEQRYNVLGKIHEQLRSDLATHAEYEGISPLFVEKVIERLGAPALEAEAQARIYALSANEMHREASRTWSLRHLSDEPTHASDRRRFPRKMVNLLTDIWVQGFSFPCRLVDISLGGARVAVQEPEALAPALGTEVRVIVPDKGIRNAIVVFVSESLEMGLRFLDQPQLQTA